MQIKDMNKDSSVEHWCLRFIHIFKLFHIFFEFFKSIKGDFDKQKVHMST